MNAKVIIAFTISNVCSEEDLRDTGMTFDEMVRFELKEEGPVGIADQNLGVCGDYEIISIEQIKELDT